MGKTYQMVVDWVPVVSVGNPQARLFLGIILSKMESQEVDIRKELRLLLRSSPGSKRTLLYRGLRYLEVKGIVRRTGRKLWDDVMVNPSVIRLASLRGGDLEMAIEKFNSLGGGR